MLIMFINCYKLINHRFLYLNWQKTTLRFLADFLQPIACHFCQNSNKHQTKKACICIFFTKFSEFYVFGKQVTTKWVMQVVRDLPETGKNRQKRRRHPLWKKDRPLYSTRFQTRSVFMHPRTMKNLILLNLQPLTTGLELIQVCSTLNQRRLTFLTELFLVSEGTAITTNVTTNSKTPTVFRWEGKFEVMCGNFGIKWSL